MNHPDLFTLLYSFLIFTCLFVIELAYFRIANHFNIIDKPNHRSSHTQVTLRGGGIIFPIGVLGFALLYHFQYAWFLLGLGSIAAISFADDIKEQSKKIRLLIHFAAASMLLYQAGIFQLVWYWWPIAFIGIIGLLNASNFMDGINGMATANTFTALVFLYIVNQQNNFVNDYLILFVLLGNTVFAYFNFRTKARCFAGDVGSISMAFCLLFFTTMLLVKTGSFLPLLLFAVYVVDTTLTMLHRIGKRENILQPHRQHLYQYLANEKKWPHLLVSTVYALVQAAVNTGIILLYKKKDTIQLMYAAMVLLTLAAAYITIKWKVLRN